MHACMCVITNTGRHGCWWLLDTVRAGRQLAAKRAYAVSQRLAYISFWFILVSLTFLGCIIKRHKSVCRGTHHPLVAGQSGRAAFSTGVPGTKTLEWPGGVGGKVQL